MRKYFLAIAFLNLLFLPTGEAAVVGDKAPDPDLGTWLNTTSPVKWESLSGRVILIEKWATY